MSRLLVYVHYLLDYERYDTELCENSDKPAMQCHGMCQLNDELNAVSEDQPNEAIPLEGLRMKSFPEFIHHQPMKAEMSFMLLEQHPLPYHSSMQSCECCCDIFHPPKEGVHSLS
jgi:hypothetical protein